LQRDALQQLAEQAPAGRPAAPEEIAEAIVFLATDRAMVHSAGRWRRNRRDFVARVVIEQHHAAAGPFVGRGPPGTLRSANVLCW